VKSINLGVTKGYLQYDVSFPDFMADPGSFRKSTRAKA